MYIRGVALSKRTFGKNVTNVKMLCLHFNDYNCRVILSGPLDRTTRNSQTVQSASYDAYFQHFYFQLWFSPSHHFFAGEIRPFLFFFATALHRPCGFLRNIVWCEERQRALTRNCNNLTKHNLSLSNLSSNINYLFLHVLALII